MLSRTGWSSIIGIVLVCGLTLVSIRLFEGPVIPGRAITLTRAPIPDTQSDRLAMTRDASFSVITGSQGILNPVEAMTIRDVDPPADAAAPAPFTLASSRRAARGSVFRNSGYRGPAPSTTLRSPVEVDIFVDAEEPESLADKFEGPPLRVAGHVGSSATDEPDPVRGAYDSVPYSNLPDPFADPVPDVEAVAISEALSNEPADRSPELPFADAGVDPSVGFVDARRYREAQSVFGGSFAGPAGQIRIEDESFENAFDQTQPAFEDDAFVNSITVPTLQVSAPTPGGGSHDSLNWTSGNESLESISYTEQAAAAEAQNQVAETVREPETQLSETAAPAQNNAEDDGRTGAGQDIEPVVESEPAWPVAEPLLLEIEYFRNHELTTTWADGVHQLLDLLSTIETVEHRDAGTIFDQLEGRFVQIDDYVRNASVVPGLSLEQQQFLARLKRLNYKFSRTLDIWKDVYELAGAGYDARTAGQEPMLLASARRISFANIDPSWHDYLLIPEATREFASLNPDPARQQDVARRMLARITSSALDQNQRSFVLNSFSEEAMELLLDLATGQPELESVLELMHDIESRPSGYVDYRLNDIWQSLIWSDDERLHRLAAKINVHYRNANFRMAIHEDLLNRMVPQMPATTEPVSEHMMGARISGQSQIQNRLFVKLVPDREHIHFNVETDGSVHSDTTASRSGVTVQNQGIARFRVFKRLQIGINGIVSDLPVSWADADQQVVGVRSDYDPIPIVGRIARNIARQKVAEQTPQTNQMVRQRVAEEAEELMQQQVEQQIVEARQYMQENVLQPLVAMDLEPQPFQLATTDDLMIARYRIAGYDQMAASTSRPHDLPGALLNMQLHQSTINNLLSRQGLNGTRFTVAELAAHLQEVLGTDKLDMEGEDPDAHFEFTHFDPMRVDFENGEIVVSLNLTMLQVGRKKWRNVPVRATYIPEVHGTTIVLVRKGPGISLPGKRMRLRDQLAMRTIFGTLFKEQYEIGTLPAEALARINSPDLGIAALHLEDGWLGLAFADLVTGQPRVISPDQYREGYPQARTSQRDTEEDSGRRVIYSNR